MVAQVGAGFGSPRRTASAAAATTAGAPDNGDDDPGRTRMLDTPQLEAAIWSIADGRSSDDDLALFHADERASLVVLDRLIVDAEDDLDSVRTLPGDERDQVVADLTDTLESLRVDRRPPAARADRRPPTTTTRTTTSDAEDLEPGEVQLQASWADGQVVVWAAGRGTPPESNDELSTRLEAIGGPPLGWQIHPSVAAAGRRAAPTRSRSR